MDLTQQIYLDVHELLFDGHGHRINGHVARLLELVDVSLGDAMLDDDVEVLRKATVHSDLTCVGAHTDESEPTYPEDGTAMASSDKTRGNKTDINKYSETTWQLRLMRSSKVAPRL